jgi:hypothetical protein
MEICCFVEVLLNIPAIIENVVYYSVYDSIVQDAKLTCNTFA